MKDKNFRQKTPLLIKYVLIWFMLMGVFVINASRTAGQGLRLLIIDVRTGFADNPFLLHQFKNKLLFLSVLFVILIAVTLFTEDFKLRLKIGKWKAELGPESGILRWGSNLCLVAVTFCFIGMVVILAGPQLQQTDRGGWRGDLLVAHACGGIEGMDYTNSADAFERSYQEGIRVMEVDFQLTSDDRLVCVHEWDAQMDSNHEEGYVYSREEFMNIQVFDRFTPMSLETLFELMRTYEDVWIITDTKDTDWAMIKKDFQVLVETAEEMDSLDLLDRFVVQLYNYDMYDAVEEVYPFPSYILTLYMMGEPDDTRFTEYCRFCKSRDIDFITMWDYWVTPQLISIAQVYGMDIYVHTVNDLDDMERLRDMGVRGVYTDYLTPQMVEEKD